MRLAPLAPAALLLLLALPSAQATTAYQHGPGSCSAVAPAVLACQGDPLEIPAGTVRLQAGGGGTIYCAPTGHCTMTPMQIDVFVNTETFHWHITCRQTNLSRDCLTVSRTGTWSAGQDLLLTAVASPSAVDGALPPIGTWWAEVGFP